MRVASYRNLEEGIDKTEFAEVRDVTGAVVVVRPVAFDMRQVFVIFRFDRGVSACSHANTHLRRALTFCFKSNGKPLGVKKGRFNPPAHPFRIRLDYFEFVKQLILWSASKACRKDVQAHPSLKGCIFYHNHTHFERYSNCFSRHV